MLDIGAWGYRSYREHLADRFGAEKRIRKCCLQAGFSCPNLDGSRGRGGCTYCNNAGFAPGLADAGALRRQWDRGRDALRHRHGSVDGFIAYFQSFSNTHAPVDELHQLYDPFPIAYPECVGVAIGTRPDCVPDPVLDLIADIGQRTMCSLELGLQSDQDAVLRRLNRGHTVAEFHDAVDRAASRDIELCVHLILGLPGEGDDAPERMGRLMASLPVQSIKIHNLHRMSGTAMAREPERWPMPERPAYLEGVLRLLNQLRPDQCVQRLIADAPDRLLVGGVWAHDKQRFLADLRAARRTEAVA